MTALWLLLIACNDGMDDTDMDTDTGADSDTDTEMDTQAPDDRWAPLRAALSTDLLLNDAPAVSVAVYEDGEVVFAEAYGTTTVGGDVDVTPDTLFQISASANVLTSIAVLQGVEAELFDVNDNLTTLLPELVAPPADASMWEQTTLHTLMTQQTGMFDFIEWSEAEDASRSQVSLVEYPSYSPFDNPPGRFFNYSYTNFAYAGVAREVAQDGDIADILEDDVFTPLGMLRTTVRRDDVSADGDYALGTGFLIEEDGSTRALDVSDLTEVPHPPFTAAAGTSTWSTPTEMMQLADFLLNGNTDVLSDELRADITTPQVPLLSTVDDAQYGYGMYIRPGLNLETGYRPATAWEHGGHTLQYTSDFYILPDQNYAVSILSSGNDTNFAFSLEVALELAIGLPDVIDTPEHTLDPARLADHVGRYTGPPSIRDIIVAQEDGGLVWTLPSYDAAEVPYERTLQTISSTLFVGTLNGTQYGITFIGDEGSPSEFIRNRFWVASRSPLALTESTALPITASEQRPSYRHLMGLRTPLTTD